MKIIDGGLSTQLALLGAEMDDPLWTGRVLLDAPNIVEQAHADYVAAGAEAVITASYQLSRQGFLASGLTVDDADRALTESVAVARRAVDRSSRDTTNRQALVAASVGPFGAISHDGAEYRGNYGLLRAELARFHSDRLRVLVEARPDVLAVETIPDLLEAEALADALANTLEVFADVPTWFSFTCADDERLWAGQPIEDAVGTIVKIPGLAAVGVNCVEPYLVAGLARRIRTVTNLPIIAYPNRGGSWDAESNRWVGARTESFAEWLPEWRDAGVEIVGGCCGTDAHDIAALRKAADV